jgi:hypothetical protein
MLNIQSSQAPKLAPSLIMVYKDSGVGIWINFSGGAKIAGFPRS